MVHDCFGEWEVASTTAEAASLLEVAGKPSSTKTKQPHLFFHDHLRLTSNSGIFLQTWWSVRELRSAAALKDRPRNAWASLRLSPGAQWEALTGQREQAHIRPCPASNYCKDCKAFKTVSYAFFFSTKFPEEETGQDSLIVPALPPSHESQESQRKKLQEELTVILLVCAVDPYSLGSQFKSFHYPPLPKQVQKLSSSNAQTQPKPLLLWDLTGCESPWHPAWAGLRFAHMTASMANMEGGINK